jgi:hypothetical protein
MNKTTPCANPPGGDITCRDDQLAICGIIDGEYVSGCFDQPLSARFFFNPVKKKQAIDNWVLARLTGAKRGSQQAITDEEHAILRAEFYASEDGRTSVMFSSPAKSEEESGSGMAAGAGM